MVVTIDIKEDGKPLKTIELDENSWRASDSGTYEIAYVGTWVRVEDRWGYQLSLHLQRPPAEIRRKHGEAEG